MYCLPSARILIHNYSAFTFPFSPAPLRYQARFVLPRRDAGRNHCVPAGRGMQRRDVRSRSIPCNRVLGAILLFLRSITYRVSSVQRSIKYAALRSTKGSARLRRILSAVSNLC